MTEQLFNFGEAGRFHISVPPELDLQIESIVHQYGRTPEYVRRSFVQLGMTISSYQDGDMIIIGEVVKPFTGTSEAPKPSLEDKANKLLRLTGLQHGAELEVKPMAELENTLLGLANHYHRTAEELILEFFRVGVRIFQANLDPNKIIILREGEQLRVIRLQI